MSRTLADLGENAFLSALLPTLPRRPDVHTGPGDDCAVVHLRGMADDLLLTTDPVIEGRHFAADTPPGLVGKKAVHRAISDIAAMGGTPRWLLLGLIAPAETPLARIRAICRSINETAARWNLAVIGGDTAQGGQLVLNITIIGSIPHGDAVLRSTGRVGDLIYVSGRLGGNWRNKATRHLTFTPRIAEGAFIAENHWATAMMDLSDGLATDLHRFMAASGTGAVLYGDAIPRRPGVSLEAALEEGEDYELLFTAGKRKANGLEASWRAKFPDVPLTCIGHLTSEPGELFLIDEQNTPRIISSTGFQHFRPTKK